MAIEQVVAILGQPMSIIGGDPKKIYVYKNLKVIFVDGKLTEVQ
jgi:hypothetical protein